MSPASPSANQKPPNDSAFYMMKDGKTFEEFMPVQMEAVAQLRDGHPQSDAIHILSQTGHLLMRHGDYVEALDYLQEASDSAQLRVDAGRIDPSMIRLYNNLASLYSRIGLGKEALALNAKALEISRKEDNLYACDLWRMRGAMYTEILKDAENKQETSDSILYCLRMAYTTIPLMPEDLQDSYRAQCNFDRAALFVENPEHFADSIKTAIRLLEDKSKNHTLKISTDVLLGRAYLLTGRPDEGIALMEKGLEEFRRQDWKESIAWSLSLLASSYAETGRGDRLAEIYPEVRDYSKELLDEAKINAVIGADFRYKVRDKEREVEQLRLKNERSRRIILLSVSTAILGLLIGIFLTITYLKLRWQSKAEKEKYEKEIADILQQQVTLNSKIEHLNEQLQTKETSEIIDNVTQQLDPTLLSGEDETHFRKAFMSLHPHFLSKLRDDYPSLTSADELLCMLIYLKVPAVDMAATLGISRPSLNSARYRVRKRLNLDKETDLDSFIQSIRS